jgi:glycosyltransferase involved in cell wall biosynthesis
VDYPAMVHVHIITYDIAGTVLATGQAKPCRTSGLVTHTHQLLAGLHCVAPTLRVAVSHTGAMSNQSYLVRTGEGRVVLVQGILSRFRDYLSSGDQPGKDPARVRYFYEDTIDHVDNPVYASLARQYADVIRVGGTPHVVAQNINPIVSTLKAEEFGYLTTERAGRLSITGVVHDTADATSRFAYVARRLSRTGHRVRLIAVSGAVRAAMLDAGIPAGHLHIVPNGLDVAGFQQRLTQARATGVFDNVAIRNGLPRTGTMILVSARRVEWKGHLDVIDAVAILARRGMTDFHVVFNGNNMLDSRALDYESVLRRRIAAAGLEDRIFLLDDLNPEEVVACYDAAAIAVHPSRQPEAWGYANIEAMLAGAAVIAAGHGAPVDYIEHGRGGLLVPPRDPAAIAEAMQRLLADSGERERLAEHGRAVAAQFTVEAMATAYHRVITGQAMDDERGMTT